MFKWLFGNQDDVDLSCENQMRVLHDTLVDMKQPGVEVPRKGWFISAIDGKVHEVDLEERPWNPFGSGK